MWPFCTRIVFPSPNGEGPEVGKTFAYILQEVRGEVVNPEIQRYDPLALLDGLESAQQTIRIELRSWTRYG
jgi:hypothetical protein